jgi:trehalose 6-phosphate synthase/phosphatase
MRLIIVSNRLPFSVAVHDGKFEFQASSGGLTTGLWSSLQHGISIDSTTPETLWLGWPGATVPAEHEPEVRRYAEPSFQAIPVPLSDESLDRFYHGFCNKTLWPLFHYLPSLTRYEEDYWLEYKRVNRIFADALLRVMQPDDLIWIHDYQLMLLPQMIREAHPDASIGFFLHIPFPSYEVFRLLPRSWAKELVEGVLGAGLIGFHTHDYTRDFLTCVLRVTGCEHQLGLLTLRDRLIKVDTFPMGIDFERFALAADAPETAARVTELKARCAGQKVIFSVDRLDYTKGILNRLRGYETFLKRHPEWHEKVVFIMSIAPSRIAVESYQAMKHELEQTVGRIVGAYGTLRWTPLVYQFRNLGFDEIVAMYRACDVALITPLRDGMNLVAKEFVASRPDKQGVLILSEMAGAAKEMGEAILINPVHRGEIAAAIEQALTMTEAEQLRRNELLQERLRRYDVNRWTEDFLQGMLSSRRTDAAQRARNLTGRVQASLAHSFNAASRSAFFLDYDGTLVPFANAPAAAQPDAELLETLSRLSALPGASVVIVSGRSRSDLSQWFGALPVGLIAEHGVWLRTPGADWRMLKTITAEWKARVRPILQLYVDRLPGAQLEEKEFSLAWHYRRADPEQATQRARELLDDLAGYTRNIDVQVLEGNKVLEVRNTGVSKGTAVSEWLTGHVPDFTLAIGDDWTDEDMFRLLPSSAWSVRVGLARTAARFHLSSHTAVRKLLRALADVKPQHAPAGEPAASISSALLPT